jgi:hypothetical protein
LAPREFTPDEIRRSRIKAGLLFAIAIVPLIAATTMYYTGWGIPGSTTNNGEFVDTQDRISDLNLDTSDNEPFTRRFLPENEDAKWWIIVTADNCEQACRQWLEVSRSVHRRLHRDADRVRRGFVVADGSVPDPADHPRIVTLNGPDGGNPFSSKARASDKDGTVFVVDPMGNLVLRYDSRHNGTDLLDDVEHLLDSSPLG